MGKTAIVEGLAQQIVTGEVPQTLARQEALHPRPRCPRRRLPLSRRLRGAAQEGLEGDQDRGDIIIFIDEIHTLVGAGAAEGAIDAASILKPMLARGELQTIGATTLEEYRKYLEKDSALERRFQPVQVDEPSVADTIQILLGLKDRYESHHSVRFTDQAIVSAANLADRYLSDRFLPDKAIDLIDEAGSRMRITRSADDPEFADIDQRLSDVRSEKQDAVSVPAIRACRSAARPRAIDLSDRTDVERRLSEEGGELAG